MRASTNDRENAIKETSQQVAATTSAAVTRTVTDLYSQMISDQKSQIAQLQNALAAQGKDVNTIKSSNIVTGKSPIKVEVTNGTPQSNQEWAFSRDKENAFVSRARGVTATFQIQAAVDDPESFRFAEQLDARLKQAGWTEVGGGVARAVYGGRFEGVVLHVSEQNFQAAANLQMIFQGMGLNAAGNLDQSIPKGQVRISVGYKPDYWKY